jgi:hypothetical protein
MGYYIEDFQDENKDYKFIKAEPKGKKHLWMTFDNKEGKVHGRLNASWKISSLAVNGQSFLVIDGYLLNFISF